VDETWPWALLFDPDVSAPSHERTARGMTAKMGFMGEGLCHPPAPSQQHFHNTSTTFFTSAYNPTHTRWRSRDGPAYTFAMAAALALWRCRGFVAA
jgi:hypothetical protein